MDLFGRRHRQGEREAGLRGQSRGQRRACVQRSCERRELDGKSCSKGAFAKKSLSRWAGGALCAAIVLVVWQAASCAVGAAYILPTPLEVLARAAELAPTAEFWRAVGFSLARVALGFAGGMILGIALAVLSAALPFVRSILSPLVRVLRTVPVVCFVLLMLLWLNSTWLPVVVSALMVFPVAWTGTVEAFDAIDPGVVEVANAYDLGTFRRLFRLYFPSIVPQLLSMSVVALGLAWKSSVTAEVLALPFAGMGTSVYRAKIALEAADIFVWACAIVALSWAMEAALRALVARAARRWGR